MRKNTPFPASSTTDSVPLMTHVLSFLEDFAREVSLPWAREGKRGHPETLTVAHLLLVCLLQMVRKNFSPAAVALTAMTEPVGSFACLDKITRQAVRQRLLALGLQPFRQMLHQVQEHLAQREGRTSALSLASFASMVVAVDETKLSAVARLCEETKALPKKSERLVVGKLSALFDVRNQSWVHVQFLSDPMGSGLLSALLLIEQVPKASLILADLGYFSFAWFRFLTDEGYFWLSRLKSKSGYRQHHVYYQKGETLDALVWLGTYQSHQYPHLVRLIQYRHGTTLYRYITNVLDPTLLPLSDIPRLYARRWDIEMAFKFLKRTVGLHVWWASEQTLVLQQLLLSLLLAQVIHCMQMEIAAEAGVEPLEVSLDILMKVLPQAAWPCPFGMVAALVSHARSVGLIRPSRYSSFDLPEILSEHLRLLPLDSLPTRPWKQTVRKKPRHPRRTDPFDFRFVPLLLI